MRAEWIYAAIQAGELSDHDAKDDVRYVVNCEWIGKLRLPGGRVVAADPYTMGVDPQPFIQTLSASEADVVAARAVIGEGHERLAALILLAGFNPVVEWQMSTIDDQDVSALDGDEFFGYGVDAGTGSFGSPEAMRTVGRVLGEDAGMLEDPLSAALFRDGVGTRSAVVAAPEDGAIPVAMCSSGWGDGVYPTWLGVDDSGDVVVAVTDFLLTGDPHASPMAEKLLVEEPLKKSLFQRWFRS